MNCSEWLHILSDLNLGKGKGQYSELTFNLSPNKPLLLLALLDLFDQGRVTTNLIQYTEELDDAFNLYLSRVLPEVRNTTGILPFYHLKNEKGGFWHLVPVPGKQQELDSIRQIKTLSKLNEYVVGVRLDDTLFDVLITSECREAMRRHLIQTYFAPPAYDLLLLTSKIANETLEYSDKLQSQVAQQFKPKKIRELSLEYSPESRSTAFRRIVVDAYAHYCAACGLQLITPEGRTAVEAAHIIPWSCSYNDDPRNGISLCKVHHWAFDEGLITVTHEYKIKISPIVKSQRETALFIYNTNNQQIILPKNVSVLPAKEALEWHYKNTFRRNINSLRRPCQ